MSRHLLSIQSHVAYGHVGNSAAVFPLQRQGFEVTAIHTVQFSNHTGYGAYEGDVFSPEHLLRVLNGLEDRGVFDKMNALLTGYLGDQHTGEVALEALQRIRRHHPDAFYCCDPVMGDVDRGFYVREGVPEWFRDHAIEHADIITPNQFELSFLADCSIETTADAMEAAAFVRSKGPKQVLLTSLNVTELPDDQIGLLLDNQEGSWLVVTPKFNFPIELNGAGDVTCALFFSQLLKGSSSEQALQFVAASIYALFKQTYQSHERELQLIAAQDEMFNPSRKFHVKRLR